MFTGFTSLDVPAGDAPLTDCRFDGATNEDDFAVDFESVGENRQEFEDDQPAASL